MTQRKSLIPIRSPTADAMSEPALVSGSLPPILPPLTLAVCIACVAGAGALANCALLAALLKRSRNGLFYLLIQLAIADLILLGTTITPELWSYNIRTWSFGRSGCIAFRGLNVFSTTASLYLIATVAFHSLATCNLEEKAVRQASVKRDDGEEDDEIRSSRHSLVASDTSTPRTMNVDYSLSNRKVRIAPPVVFVWILSTSLSIPEFVLATTVHLDQDIVLCTLVDTSHRLNMHSLLAIFNLFLPIVIMSTASILILYKLKKKRLHPDTVETYSALKLSLYLIYTYAALCTPRSIVMVYSLYSTSTSDNEYALEQPDYFLTFTKLVCSCVYLAATAIRPLLCMILLPRLRKVLFFGIRNSNVDI